MSRIRVLHLITELSTGGAQSALLRLLSHLDRERYEPEVACWYNGEASVAQEIRALGVPVTDLGMNAKWRVDAFWRFYRLLRRRQPHILHTWLFHANLPGRVLGRMAGVPVIVSSERTMEMEGQVRRRLNRLTAPLANRIICVSERVAAFAREEMGLPAERLVVIPNGVDLARFAAHREWRTGRAALGIPADALVVGTVSRLDPVKGLPVLLEALAKVNTARSNDTPGLYWLLAGDGPELPALRRQAERLGLARQVLFLGQRSDIAEILGCVDIFALPSLYEGMPNAVLEAMAAGLPVVATRAGGIGDVVIDEATGLLVPPGDAPALAEALGRLLADPALRQLMGRFGRQRVESEFSLTEMVRKTELLYEILLKERLPESQRRSKNQNLPG